MRRPMNPPLAQRPRRPPRVHQSMCDGTTACGSSTRGRVRADWNKLHTTCSDCVAADRPQAATAQDVWAVVNLMIALTGGVP